MSRNIKEIGKELLGKSLNSFHRKTGLTQLEKNNEMQDGILNGILSQVDDAYIEKTEQSNVIHLDGGGDGVVVLDSIEGNTMVNLWSNPRVDKDGYLIYPKGEYTKYPNSFEYGEAHMIKPSTVYTFIVDIMSTDIEKAFEVCFTNARYCFGYIAIKQGSNMIGRHIIKATSKPDLTNCTSIIAPRISLGTYINDTKFRIMLLEGDWTNRDLPPYFEGLQSSFEEKVNDEGKYEIEILSQNKNLIDKEYFAEQLLKYNAVTREYFNGKDCLKINGVLGSANVQFGTNDNQTKVLRMSCYTTSEDRSSICHYGQYLAPATNGWSNSWGRETYNYVDIYNYVDGRVVYIDLDSIQVEYGDTYTSYIPHKSNKIKLLLNEPLRSVGNVKDRLCVKDSKLVVERNLKEIVINNTSNIIVDGSYLVVSVSGYNIKSSLGLSDKFAIISLSDLGKVKGLFIQKRSDKHFYVWFSNNENTTVQDLKTWLQNNPTKLVFQTIEPYYEEVLNEYGEPIILEGYENGTIYIDSTIVPTTTVRYTPKMQSFKTLNEVSDNNIMLTNDINDNIIPYLMDVDLMIMEKEMALPSQINIRKMEALDMTSMQKRTQDMLERLIKGKTLTEQECKTRVAAYLNAGKITDEQAKELNFLIDEIYA